MDNAALIVCFRKGNCNGFFYPGQTIVAKEQDIFYTTVFQRIQDRQPVFRIAGEIETPIPADEFAAYRALHTNYPYTTAYNKEGCWMEMAYVADPGNHIEQNYVAKDVYDSLEQRVAALENQAVSS